MTTSTIRPNAVQIITENFKKEATGMTLFEYAKQEAKNDPGFYQWLFPGQNVGEFGNDITIDQQDEAHEFFVSLQK